MSNFNDYSELINNKLLEYLPDKNNLQKTVVEAMEYSLKAGGKRIRPVLVLEFCRVCGGDINKALPFACAIEMSHTYSLIHDDLPCMDDDDFRRGRPSNHVVFGEAMATLAGDALLTRAFEIMLAPETVKNVGADKAVKAAACLADNLGVYGMVGGQVIDLESENKIVGQDVLDNMHKLKTGALITACAEIGCIIAGASEDKIKAAVNYAKAIGLAFQIVDDILDVTSTTEKLGKKVGSDKDENKSTYVSIMGLEKSRQTVKELTDKALSALDEFGDDNEFLKNLAISLANREK